MENNNNNNLGHQEYSQNKSENKLVNMDLININIQSNNNFQLVVFIQIHIMFLKKLSENQCSYSKFVKSQKYNFAKILI